MGHVDAVVVGAGPAGCSAAMVLAAAGRRVVLLERARMPRYKACGGGVVRRALDSLPCRPPGEKDLSLLPLHRVRVQYADQPPLVVERAEAPVMMIMRADFDRYLATRAVEAGVECVEGANLTSVRRDGDAFSCATSAGEWRAPVVIGADGAESRVARLLPGIARLGVALEGELAPPPGAEERADGGEARFDFAVLPEGYGWVFPKRDGLSVGLFSRRLREPRLRAAYGEYVRGRDLGGARETRLTGHRIPVAPRRRLGDGGLLLVGDAAGLADPLTGEGISFAIRSGRRAAEAVLAVGPGVDRAAAAYEAAVADLLREIRLARFLAAALYVAPGTAFRLFRRHAGFAEAVVDVFSGHRTYGDLVGSILRHPWRLLTPERPRDRRPA